MLETKSVTITCPHCGHHCHLEVDYSNGDQDYYEDCANCCNAIHLVVHLDEVKRKVEVRINADDEQIY